MKASVIFSTYKAEAWLEKVLWGFFAQTFKDFEIIVADDGSGEETRVLLDRMRQASPVPLHHVWQPDDGFQKCRILNKAIAKSSHPYLIFTDGDCIPRADFVEQHIQRSEHGVYLSGGYFKLPMSISQRITREDVETQRAFDLEWLVAQGLKKTHKSMKLTADGAWAQFLNWASPAKPTWNGHNASCHREFVLAVNGFDERMQYGGEDCEFGDRLLNLGLKAKRIRYSAICLHLDHARGYVTEAMLAKNRKIREETRLNRATRSPLGVDQYLSSLASGGAASPGASA